MNRGRAEPTPPECAAAAEMFDLFCSAGTMKSILACHRQICQTLNLKPNRLPDFYPKLKSKLASSWKAQALFKKFDARANHKVYAKGRAGASSKVLVIGAGPCGLRAAIECQLLGAKVVVIEKRDRMSRNNVLHLWPFVIQDLRALGAKKFFGKFCAGSIDHISIRQLQCILMKVALLLGVEFHEGVSFEELLEPTVTENSETLGWRARVLPAAHAVAQYEFDVLLGADGKRNTLRGFKRKEFRGKLAMAITANFINRHSEQEAAVPEISGVAFIFNQKFFKELHAATGIDLENIVYYKDDTHYFVMTAKKHSLRDKGVLINDYAEVSRLLAVENVDRCALMRYAQEAARFSTGGRLPLRDFALNHYGEPDVALFDFTSMYAAENASLVRERFGRRLLCQLVGDSLLEPFWPTGSGCARGFLSALDAAWAVRAWAHAPPHPLHVVAERESVYRLLAQTTPENLHRDVGAYTLDPGTRYPNLNRAAVAPHRVAAFYESDEPQPLDAAPAPARKRRREPELSDDALAAWVGVQAGGLRAAAAPPALAALVRRYRPDLLPPAAPPRAVYTVLHHDLGIAPPGREAPEARLRAYLARVYLAFKGEVPHVHHQTELFDQIKQSLQKEKHVRHATDHSISAYSNAAEADKSHSSYRKKRRSVRTPQVSSASAEYLRRKVGQLQLGEVSHLARLLDPTNPTNPADPTDPTDKQRLLHEQILALLEPDDAPNPDELRESLVRLLQGGVKTRVKPQEKLANFFIPTQEQKPLRPPRKLKGLDASTIRVPDFSDIFLDDSDTDATLVRTEKPKKKQLIKAASVDIPYTEKSVKESSVEVPKKQSVRAVSTESLVPKGRSQTSDEIERRHSQSPVSANTRRIAMLFEGGERRRTPSPGPRTARSVSINPEMALRMQRMADIIEGKKDWASPERVKLESIGDPELASRRQKMSDLIEGRKVPEPRAKGEQRRGSGELSFRMQRAAELVAKKAEGARRGGGGRRRAAREITRLRFERSVQLLGAEPRAEGGAGGGAALEHDVGLLQYRAHAPHFTDRVHQLEHKLMNYEEGRAVGGGGGSRGGGGGVRVARLAAELAGAGTTAPPAARPLAAKPKDLMRAVGRIERDDWNVREIERKIMENRLGRPEPRAAEKVPKWDREQFLGRQRRLKEGENEEKWMEIDETLSKLDQKLRDSGRPHHGTNKVANLATKFVKKDDNEPETKPQPKEECKKSWRATGAAPAGGVCGVGGAACAACGRRVFAAEGVTADGLHLHRACFKCATCACVLRPGNYTMERYGTRLVCLRHSGASVPDAGAVGATAPPRARPLPPAAAPAPTPTPERISLELSDGAREIDEDEWTDRNFLASETSAAGGISSSEEGSSSDDEYSDAEELGAPDEPPAPAAAGPPHHNHLYFSDDSFGYDDYSDDGAESSGNESCSRMRALREARRREVPADARAPPTDSSEVESEEESSASSSASSATEVSTDSEFARDEPPAPPAILVTAPPPPAPHRAPPTPPHPLSRARSAGGLATKRALELKRKYLLGEPSPPAVRKSDSTSQIDTKLEAFRSTITEFQKMLHPAPSPSPQPQNPILAFNFSSDEKSKPMPDIIQNLCTAAPVDLLTKGDAPLCKKEWREEPISEEKKDPGPEPDLESDSLSDSSSSHTETAPPPADVPRVEVHDEGGELIQLDSLLLVGTADPAPAPAPAPDPAPALAPTAAIDSESSESCHDATTLALTETELSDWAAESAVLDDCGFEEDRKRNKNPRTLSGPKLIHDAKNISAISSHVCGRSSPPRSYCAAYDDFEFADEGESEPVPPLSPRNHGYMELVDDDPDPDPDPDPAPMPVPAFAPAPSLPSPPPSPAPARDRSMDFIERTFSETVFKPASREASEPPDTPEIETLSDRLETPMETKVKDSSIIDDAPTDELKSPQLLKSIELETSEKSSGDSPTKSETSTKSETPTKEEAESVTQVEAAPELKIESLSLSGASPPLLPSTPHTAPSLYITTNAPLSFTTPASIRLYSPAICRSASETFNRSTSRSTDSPSRSMELSITLNMSSGSISPVSPTPPRDSAATDKVQELKREREQQTEVVRRLVLERLGAAPRKSARKARASPSGRGPPPVPPPPAMPPPPPRPAPPLMPLPVTPSFSDPELARERRSKSIMKSISSYLNRRLGPRQKWASEPSVASHESPQRGAAHKSEGALQQAPPVPPPPASYRPPPPALHHARRATGSTEAASCGPASCGPATAGAEEERDAMQLWFEARWARLVAQRRDRERDLPADRRRARLERRLTRPLSAEQQAAAVAELVQESSRRGAHQALLAADSRRRSAAGMGAGD